MTRDHNSTLAHRRTFEELIGPVTALLQFEPEPFAALPRPDRIRNSVIGKIIVTLTQKEIGGNASRPDIIARQVANAGDTVLVVLHDDGNLQVPQQLDIHIPELRDDCVCTPFFRPLDHAFVAMQHPVGKRHAVKSPTPDLLRIADNAPKQVTAIAARKISKDQDPDHRLSTNKE